MEINLRNLKEDVGDKLFKANLTNAKKILLLSEIELQTVGDFSLEDVKNIFYIASQTIIKPDTVLRELPLITVGCAKIDAVLGGGFRVGGGINELSGESGCGKTQLCLQLTLTTQNSISVGGINKYVLYICTEDNFPSRRLQQLINNIQSPFKNRKELAYGDRIYIEHLTDVETLKDCLFNQLPKLLGTGSVGLLVIDSIAAVFRSDYTLKDGLKRTKDLRSIGHQLHHLSKKYNICVLCVNQVTASMTKDNQSDTTPALGLAWANLVTTRILMKKHAYANTRKIETVFSPHTGPAYCDYVITEFGVYGT